MNVRSLTEPIQWALLPWEKESKTSLESEKTVTLPPFKSQYYDVFRGGGAPLWFQHSKAEARDPSSRWRNTFNPSTREAEAGGSEFQGSQDYTEKLSERQTDRWDLDPIITFKMKSSNFITSGLLLHSHMVAFFLEKHTHIYFGGVGWRAQGLALWNFSELLNS